MADNRNKSKIRKLIPYQGMGVVALFILAAVLLWFNASGIVQAHRPSVLGAYFSGEYRIGDGEWQPIIADEHIPATKGDITLRGSFGLITPDGEDLGPAAPETRLGLCLDHINVTITEQGEEPYRMDHENPIYGASVCGQAWGWYTVKQAGDEPVEILIRNPHRFGNETAVDELLRNLTTWPSDVIELDIAERGGAQRVVGMVFFVLSIVMMGIALFSIMLHIVSSWIIWAVGLITLAAGGYLIFSAEGVYFWNSVVVANTTFLVICIMFYMLFLTGLVAYYLEKTKKIGSVMPVVMGIVVAISFAVPMIWEVRLYDMLYYWVIAQGITGYVLIGCLVVELRSENKRHKNWIYIASILTLLVFQVDVFATAKGIWRGGKLSEIAFALLFMNSLLVVWRIIPQSINAAAKAKELEIERSLLEVEKNVLAAELKESRVAIMLSQIQPHFIYNTLGTIERMCLKDPQTAFELVRNFSLYLRGNFSELNNTSPIRFMEEIKHVQYYSKIEQTRFPDMEIRYELEATSFVLPALSVQPLVENAIKHGLMRLETGGTVVIRSYETETHYCVAVTDNGVGFDPAQPVDEKKHVGLRNIRGRLQAIVNGELIIESEPGRGTRATILIPKEETV